MRQRPGSESPLVMIPRCRPSSELHTSAPSSTQDLSNSSSEIQSTKEAKPLARFFRFVIQFCQALFLTATSVLQKIMAAVTGAPTNIIAEACPDIEVTMQIFQNDEIVEEIPANINMSKLVIELKQALAKHLTVEPEQLQMFRYGTELMDNHTIMHYEVEPDDVLTVNML